MRLPVEYPYGKMRLRAKLVEDLHPRMVSAQHGWWQSCKSLEMPGYDPFDPKGANINLLIHNDLIDPISGSVPHRSYLCNLRRAEYSGA